MQDLSHLPADLIELIEQVRLNSQIPWCIRAWTPPAEITPTQARRANKALGLDAADITAVFNHINGQ